MDNCQSKLVKDIRIQQKKLVDIEKKIDNIEEESEYYQELGLDKDKLEKQLNQTIKELIEKKSKDIYSNITDIYKKIEKIDVELRGSYSNLKKFKKEKELIEIKLKKECIDLINEEKIEWVELSFEDWYNSYEDEYFWIFQTDYYIVMGIWENYSDLTEEEEEHFNTFELDYFYYHGPNYYNCYYPNCEMSEAEMAREAGEANIRRICRYDL
jgi:hypothetical protein